MVYSLLIVDDEELICSGIKSMITRMEDSRIQRVLTATELCEVNDIVKNIKPEIIITDIKMPEINGLQMAEDILKINPDCRFIVLSGYDDFAYAKRALKFGAVDFLLKPASMSELQGALNKAIEQISYSKNLKEQQDRWERSLRHRENDSGNVNDADDKTIIGIAKKYVRQNYKKNIDMAVVTNIVSMNYSYFSKLFKAQTGMTFSEYVTSVRMEEAKKMLDNPVNKIYEVSESVGYENSKYFSKVFKAYYGLSPEQYRTR